MDNLLIGGGLILFLIGIIMLIASFVKKTKKKNALILILIGFIVWIIGGAFVDTETIPETPSAETDIVTENDLAKENPVDSESNAPEEDDLTSALFSDNFESFYNEITSMTTANIDNYVNSGLNKQIVWFGKVIDVYSDYAYIECIDSLSTDSAISTFCNVYAPTNTLQGLKKDQDVIFTGKFAGANARSYTGCSWVIENAVITASSN